MNVSSGNFDIEIDLPPKNDCVSAKRPLDLLQTVNPFHHIPF